MLGVGERFWILLECDSKYRAILRSHRAATVARGSKTLMERRIRRRQAILSLVGAGAAIGTYTWRIEPHWIEFSYPRLPIAGLPKQLEGCTLAQLSDLHVGPKVDDAYIIESLQRVREHSPDFL